VARRPQSRRCGGGMVCDLRRRGRPGAPGYWPPVPGRPVGAHRKTVPVGLRRGWAFMSRWRRGCGTGCGQHEGAREASKARRHCNLLRGQVSQQDVPRPVDVAVAREVAVALGAVKGLATSYLFMQLAALASHVWVVVLADLKHPAPRLPPCHADEALAKAVVRQL
jgi:hypothetical protein